MEEIKPVLQELGYSDKEIEVYLALLVSGSLGATAIAKKAQQNRITTYHLLKSLQEKGIVSYTLKSGVKYFQAVNPKTIHRILKEKEERFMDILPQLESIKESVLESPRAEVFEGKEGLKSIMNDWINTKKDIIGIGSEALDEVVGYYFPHFIKNRIKAGIKMRIMFRKSKYASKMRNKDKLELRETRIIKCGKLNTGIYVYGNKASFLTFIKEQPLGLVIEDASIVQTIKTMLELLWLNARKS